jgi:hypothetical protein
VSFYRDTASFYIVVEGTTAYYGDDIAGFKGRRLTAKKPSKLGKNEIAIKLSVRIPKQAFEAFQPEATIDIPADLAIAPSVDVAVDAPEDDA